MQVLAFSFVPRMAWYEEEPHYRVASSGDGVQGVYRELYAQSFRAAGATSFFVLKAETEPPPSGAASTTASPPADRVRRAEPGTVAPFQVLQARLSPSALSVWLLGRRTLVVARWLFTRLPTAPPG